MSNQSAGGRARYEALKKERRRCPVCMVFFIPNSPGHKYCCREHNLLANPPSGCRVQRQLTFDDYVNQVYKEQRREQRRLLKLVSDRGYVHIAWFPDAFKDSGMTDAQLSRRMGWGGSTSNVKRLLASEHCRYATALKLLEALNLDPVDVGM